MPDERHHHFDRANGTLHALERGGGAPSVVFIPSLAGSTAAFAAAARHVSAAHRAVVVDLRGHGESAPPVDGDYSIEGYAADVSFVADRLELGDVVIVGHSMGGGVAVAYAAARPDQVKRILLVDAIDDPSRRPAGAMGQFLHALEADYAPTITSYWEQILANADARVAAAVMQQLAQTPPATVVGSLRAMQRFDASRALAAITAPVTSLVSPLNDFPTSLHKLHPTIRVRRFENVSHWLHLDRPDEFARALDELLG